MECTRCAKASNATNNDFSVARGCAKETHALASSSSTFVNRMSVSHTWCIMRIHQTVLERMYLKPYVLQPLRLEQGP